MTAPTNRARGLEVPAASVGGGHAPTRHPSLVASSKPPWPDCLRLQPPPQKEPQLTCCRPEPICCRFHGVVHIGIGSSKEAPEFEGLHHLPTASHVLNQSADGMPFQLPLPPLGYVCSASGR